MDKLPPLKNAIQGNVITRFPPEASGMLHLGHIKALLINSLYARQYDGKMILRFDDTNPDKESLEYEKTILEDISTLGIEYDRLTYASDYFDQMIEYAYLLIEKNLAYVDYSDQEEINRLRLELKPSRYRESDTRTNFDLFKKMESGETKNGCLRAKIDYASKNGCLRDPVIFRSKTSIHPRHGDKYRVYPTYDFACPILDALENVTHAMRSVEYKDRDAQYEWFLKTLEIRNGIYPILLDYGKLNFSHSVLSKRKLSKLVSSKLVSGWDDPRIPTIRGIIRRGLHITPLLSYIKTQANSRATVMLSWDKLYSCNLSYLNNTAIRLYGLGEKRQIINLTGDLPLEIELPNHPKNKSFGCRTMRVRPQIIVDADDFTSVTHGSRYTLIGLGNATITHTNPLTLYYDPNDQNYKNTTKITWLPNDDSNVLVTVRKYGHLLNKPKLADGDEIVDVFNKDSLTESQWLIESSIKTMPISTIIQVMRKNFCYLDSTSNSTSNSNSNSTSNSNSNSNSTSTSTSNSNTTSNSTSNST